MVSVVFPTSETERERRERKKAGEERQIEPNDKGILFPCI